MSDVYRTFAPLEDGADPERNLGRLGRYYGRTIDWTAVREHRRIIVLAEASAGKTWEFQRQAALEAQDASVGFFVRIDNLADEPLEDALDAEAVERFERWRRDGNSDAWFFLDSVDEARLNRKSFEGALRRLGKALGGALGRARIVISCRASDWRIKDDPALIRRYLPLPQPEIPHGEAKEENEVLLDRIFPKEGERETSKIAKAPTEDLHVVQMLPLDRAQQQAIAQGAKVVDIDGFMTAIVRYGLDELAERPGDLLSLAAYWNSNHAFGSLVAMTEHAVSIKLAEEDPYRPDNGVLSPDEARHGAERLAAALTFGHAFTLLATGDQADPTLAAGALDPRKVLAEWKDDQRQALIRRGVFAPSTYGRLRFHHRTAQEFLAASWLRRLLETGCPLVRIWDLIFAERYGVETVVPSLRAVAAWLALWVPEVRDEIVRREPLTLLIHGDPRSLPIACREALLLAYAVKDEAGSVTPAYVEDRALWLFADPALEAAIRQAWTLSRQVNLHADLLRCVREGRLIGCADLARAVSIDPKRSDIERIVATEALSEFGDVAGLSAVAKSLREGPDPSLRLLTMTATELLPAALSVKDLVALLARCVVEDRQEISGQVETLLRTGTPDQRREFAYAVAAAAGGDCADEDGGEDPGPTQRFNAMLKGFGSLVLAEIEALKDGQAPENLVALLGAMPPASVAGLEERKAIFTAVGARPALNRAVFWKVVEATSREFAPFSWHQLQLGRQSWFSFNSTDLDWMAGDLPTRPLNTDQSLLFSAILAVLRQADRVEAQGAWLDALVVDKPHLQQDLVNARTPPPVDEDEPKWKAVQRRNEIKQLRQEVANKASWVKFKDALKDKPGNLADPTLVGEWAQSGHQLHSLAEWLAQEHEGASKSPKRWRDLEAAFGREVAEAFRDGLLILWRVVAPERPVYTAYNALTTNRINELALGGLAIEASDPGWIDGLSEDDVRTAVRHGAYAEHQYPTWLDELATQRPMIVTPLLVACLGEEWSRKWGRNELLNRWARPGSDVPPALAAKVLELTLGARPANSESLGRAIAILGRTSLDAQQRRALSRLAKRRWTADLKAGRNDWAWLHLALMFLADPEVAVKIFGDWLASTSSAESNRREAFAVVFGRDSSALPAQAREAISVPVLEQLVSLAYIHVGLTPDRHGTYALPARRGGSDADSARNALLSALLERTGADVIDTVRRLAREPAFAASARRFAEIAHEIAERDTERPPWTEGEVIAFERDQVAPVKSGADLLRIVVAILEDMQHSYTRADSSSAAALARLQTEEELQHYIAEQLNLRAQGRFKASRETQVSGKNKPDVLVTSHAAPVEVALEIKHGDKPSWTTSVLRSTLSAQLAEQYLLPENRRHGVLIISHHGRRTWRNPMGGKVWRFGHLLTWLEACARTVVRNRAGGVEVRVIGLDPGPLSPGS